MSTNAPFALSPARQWTCLEDYVPGLVYVFGFYDVSEEEVLEFASRYDPQEMHIDRAKAEIGEYGGLIASGWHTAGMMMRLIVDNYLPPHASLGSPGVDDLRWILPVRPGDRLAVRATIEEVRRSRSKPDRGILISRLETINQDSTVVMTMKTVSILLTNDGVNTRRALLV